MQVLCGQMSSNSEQHRDRVKRDEDLISKLETTLNVSSSTDALIPVRIRRIWIWNNAMDPKDSIAGHR